jgi:hypothetical protein
MAIGGQRLAKLLNTIFVTNAPSLQVVTFDINGFKLSWPSVPGRIYRVQSKGLINDTAWNDLAEISASTNSTAFTDSPLRTQRFYRVVVVN